MDDKAIRRAALITLRRAICKRFPPSAQREFGWDGTEPLIIQTRARLIDLLKAAGGRCQ